MSCSSASTEPNAASCWRPLAGFIYLIFNPRYTWLKGSVALRDSLSSGNKIAQPDVSLQDHAASFQNALLEIGQRVLAHVLEQCRAAELWALMCWVVRRARYFSASICHVSLAGGAGIVLFTVQHNFEHAYASSTARLGLRHRRDRGHELSDPAGMVELVYRQHRLSPHSPSLANIPDYRLVDCHDEYEHLFAGVTRVKLSQVNGALKCILWDRHARQIISVAEYQQRA